MEKLHNHFKSKKPKKTKKILKMGSFKKESPFMRKKLPFCWANILKARQKQFNRYTKRLGIWYRVKTIYIWILLIVLFICLLVA